MFIFMDAGVGGYFAFRSYYLVKKAKELGYYAKVIAAGRFINDNMHLYKIVIHISLNIL